MTRLQHIAFVSISLAVTSAAIAQDADRAASAPTGAAGFASHFAPPPSSATGSTLWDNGAYITGFGTGAAGADVSEIEPGLTLFGWGQQFSAGNRIADDFVVAPGETWSVGRLKWLAYQTNAPTTGTITGIYTEYSPFSPNAPTIAGDTTTNRLLSTMWTGVYRVTSTTLASAARAIIEVDADASFLPPLTNGHYWAKVMVDGSMASGPWAPVTVPWDSCDNCKQELGQGAGFLPTTSGFGGTPGDTPFKVMGRKTVATGVSSFCTQTKTTSVMGCLPVLTATDTSTTTGHWTTANVPFGPGTTTTIGIHFYKAGLGIGQSTFTASTGFGTLCISGFLRVLPPVFSSGSANSCTGSFDYDFGANFAALQAVDPLLQIGNDINVQGWYRDAPNPSGANFTNGIFYTLGSTVSAAALTVTGFTPSGGGEGQVITVTGTGFGIVPGNLKVLLAAGIGFADVSSAAGTTLTATVFAVGATGNDFVTVVRGFGSALVNQNLTAAGISSVASGLQRIENGTRANSLGSFNLSPSSPNTTSASFGSPLPGAISLAMPSGSTTRADIRIAFRVCEEMQTYDARVDFTGTATANQQAVHLADHLNTAFSSSGLNATASGTSVRITMAGATYGSAVLKDV